MSDSFSSVIEKLHLWESDILETIRISNEDAKLVALRVEIGKAAQCLEFCEKHGISGREKTVVLPTLNTASPSSEYRILEDHESEDRAHWIEMKIDGEFFRPLPGTILISSCC